MGKPKKEEMVRYSHWEVTPKQYDFLDRLMICGDVKTACYDSGLRYDELKRALSFEDTPFKRAYNSVLKKLDDNFDFSRHKNLYDLDKIRNRLLNELDGLENKEQPIDVGEVVSLAKAAVSVIDTMNKMVDGNLAASRKISEHKEIKLTGVIDMTKPREENAVEDGDYEDIDLLDE